MHKMTLKFKIVNKCQNKNFLFYLCILYNEYRLENNLKYIEILTLIITYVI